MTPLTVHSTPARDQKGFALITTLLILVLLTFIGLAGINNTSFEIKIAGNEKQANQRFYTADSGWKQAGPFLNTLAVAPDPKNLTLKTGDTSYVSTDQYYQIVRNYGDGGDGVLNSSFAPGTEDGRLTAIPYWYRVRFENAVQAIGFGKNYLDFHYEVLSNANGNAEVATKIKRTFNTGYE